MKQQSVIRISLVVFIAVLVCLGLWSVPQAFADRGPGPCKEDIAKFCNGVQPGQGRIIKCLQENESQLSAACKAHSACLDDIEKFCSGMQPGGGSIHNCLKQNESNLSPQCKAKLESQHQQH